MKILILGAGKMGTFFSDLLSPHHQVGIYDPDPAKLRFTYGAERFSDVNDIDTFAPQMVINAATVRYTIDAFRNIMSHIPDDCILSDIASVKTGLPEFYAECNHRYVSTHPMFGPTFASLSNLENENAIIITEGDSEGRKFFHDLYESLHLNIAEYTFAGHDLTIAYSLSIPFASTLVFASVMKHQEAPGTTFKRHKHIADGLMSEDDYLLSEILFNPHTSQQLEKIQQQLKILQTIVDTHDSDGMKDYLDRVRQNLK